MPDLSEPHRAFLARLTETVRTDGRFLGLALGGSYAANEMDEFSDLDCVLVLSAAHYAVPFMDGPAFAASLGAMVACFDGRHVNEPRLLICLFDEPVLHVDLKFVDEEGFAVNRWEDPVVLWERDGVLTHALQRHRLADHSLDVQWIEDRFWTWVHYEATKIARGELLEAAASAAWFSRMVLGPLVYAQADQRPDGVRRLEQRSPAWAAALAAALPAAHDRAAYLASLRARVALYLDLRRPFTGSLETRDAAQRTAMRLIDSVAPG